MNHSKKQNLKSLLLFMVFLVLPKLGLSQSNDGAFSGANRTRKVILPLPLGFKNKVNANIRHIFTTLEPFADRKQLASVKRYSSDMFPFTTITVYTLYRSYDPSQFKTDPNKLKEKQLTLFDVYPKRHGKPGMLFKFRQVSPGKNFMKWFAVFGNSFQTSVVCVMFPEENQEKMGNLLHETLLFADIKN